MRAMMQPGSPARSRFLRVLPLSIALLLGACASAPDNKGAQSPAGSKEPAAGASAGSGGGLGLVGTADAPGVTVISAGDEPRQPLRYTFHVGQREQMKMDMKMAMG